MQASRMELEADIRAALRQVIDPELGHNIVDLGMVYDVDVGEDGAVRLLITTTARFCPASAFLQEAAAAAASAVPGVGPVSVDLTYDPPWTPDKMAPELAVRF
ncbi:metal-sulfur cluster assembly factor [Devosia sp. XK-2]|uniref:metal-sulfur cluster assembly factor n=1 Tax=Devosia sp. XK-2 TaxID=3126689 RepID=UPI0030D5A8B6